MLVKLNEILIAFGKGGLKICQQSELVKTKRLIALLEDLRESVLVTALSVIYVVKNFTKDLPLEEKRKPKQLEREISKAKN